LASQARYQSDAASGNAAGRCGNAMREFPSLPALRLAPRISGRIEHCGFVTVDVELLAVKGPEQ
jgi:hypothetical protein